MSFAVQNVPPEAFPQLLREIPDPPRTLNYRGKLPVHDMKLLSVVGSRKYTTYGKQVVTHLIEGLSGYNVGIVSGLALGIDALAHQAALQHNLYTLAIPGSGLADQVLYPKRHRPLARRILEAGGGLLSEFDPHFTATKWSFTQRNRLMAGIAHATLLIEAAEQSGTLITARLASDYNRDVLVVPGNIFSHNCAGTHQFLKLGATPVTTAEDILYALGIDPQSSLQRVKLFATPENLSPEEKRILETLQEPRDTDTLIRESGLQTQQANVLLVQMEMRGLIVAEGNHYRRKS